MDFELKSAWVTDIAVTRTFPKLIENFTKILKYLRELGEFWMCPEVVFVCCYVWKQVFLVSVKRNFIFTKLNFVWILRFFAFVHFHLVSMLRTSGVLPLLPLCVFMTCTVTFLVRVITNTGIWYIIRAKFERCCWAYPTNCNSSLSCFCLSGLLWSSSTQRNCKYQRFTYLTCKSNVYLTWNNTVELSVQRIPCIFTSMK
jgi:hypothetical protein